MKTADAARGKWRGILMALGVGDKFLTGKHGPCPMCEGSDRFRWDNRNGGGGYICNQCGAGDGFKLLMAIKGWNFTDCAKRVDEVLGNCRADPIPKPMDAAKRVELLNNLWRGAAPLGEDMATAYLAARGVLPGRVPSCLRFHANCPVPGGDRLPAMLALVQDTEGNAINIHRTFLGPNGKADIETPRATMPGELPDGCAVRIYPVHGERLGIAEGIETAIAAAKRFNLPVWAALNSTLLAKWQPPAGVTSVVVFGDNDPAFGGQAAAYALAKRLATQCRIDVEVKIPATVGKDWADADAA